MTHHTNRARRSVSPLIIGGMPGSGTRVYRSIAVEAGFKMLVAPLYERVVWRNHHDHQPMRRFFFPRWTDRLRETTLTPRERRRMELELQASLWISGPFQRRREWGWKNPRSMFLIPTWASVYPEARFVLVVRDGRDTAVNDRFSLTHHQSWLLSPDEISQPDEIRRATMWARGNRLAVSEAEVHFPGQWMMSRLEDLCDDPDGELDRIWNFLTLGNRDRPTGLTDLVERPASLGRWKDVSPRLVADIEAVIAPELAAFGYQPVN